MTGRRKWLISAFGLGLLAAPFVIFVGLELHAEHRATRGLEALAARGWALGPMAKREPPDNSAAAGNARGVLILDRHSVSRRLLRGQTQQSEIRDYPPTEAWRIVAHRFRDDDARPFDDYEGWLSRAGRLIDTASTVCELVGAFPIQASDLAVLEPAIAAADRPELLVALQRAELGRVLDRFPPTDAGLDALEKALGEGKWDWIDLAELGERAARVKEFFKYPRFLRKFLFLEDRARLIELAPEIFEAMSAPPGELRRRMREVQRVLEAVDPARAPLSTTQLIGLERRVSWAGEVPVRLLLLRAALRIAVATEAGGGDLPETLVVDLDDPFAPREKLRARRLSEREFRVWSVGVDGIDHGGTKGSVWDSWGYDVVENGELPPR